MTRAFGAVGVAAVLVLGMTGHAVGGDGVRSVNGGYVGQTAVEDPFPDPLPPGTYFPTQGTISVVERPNGEVDGHFFGKFLGNPHDFKTDVVCVSFDGNQAWIGVELITSPFPFPPEFGIWVEDNGQGAKAAPDRISAVSFIMDFFGTAQEWCDLQQDELTIFEIDNGNLRVNS